MNYEYPSGLTLFMFTYPLQVHNLHIFLFQVLREGDQPWDFFGRNDAKAETPVLWPPHVKSWLIGKDSDAGRDWGQEEKGTTGWDGWMASPTRWIWVWVNSGSWWWTGRPGVLWFMGSQRVGHDWATELNWATNTHTHTHTHTHSLREANMKHTNHYYKNKPINPWNKNILNLRILWAAKRLKILANGPAYNWP